MQMMGTFIKPMHPEGIKFVAIFAAVTLVLFLISTFLGWIGVGLTVWCYYFFRGFFKTMARVCRRSRYLLSIKLD